MVILHNILATIMSRLTGFDIFQVWFFAAIVAFVLTGVIKYSLVASVFAVANFLLLAHFMALAPSENGRNLALFSENLKVVAHRGAGDDQPENTMAAFVYSATAGASAIELDVSLTSDGVPVCLHDDTLDRTTDGTGPIRNVTWEEARKLNAAAKFQGKITGKSDVGRFEPIPKLSDVVDLAVEKGLRVFFDVKDCDEKAIAALLEIYQRHPVLYRMAAVCSFFHSVTLEVKRRDPRIMIGHTYRHNFYAYEDIIGTVPRFAHSPAMQMLATFAD